MTKDLTSWAETGGQSHIFPLVLSVSVCQLDSNLEFFGWLPAGLD